MNPEDIPHGVWLGASVRSQQAVPVDQPYPHVCRDVPWPAQRRDCAACAEGRPFAEEVVDTPGGAFTNAWVAGGG